MARESQRPEHRESASQGFQRHRPHVDRGPDDPELEEDEMDKESDVMERNGQEVVYEEDDDDEPEEERVDEPKKKDNSDLIFWLAVIGLIYLLIKSRG